MPDQSSSAKPLRFFVSAGEASGDLHASGLITRLREQAPQSQFTFLGGDLMAAAAGCAPLIHYRDMAYMGIAEVLRHLPEIARNMRVAKEAIEKERPDALILIDYPSFNLKLARHARKLGIPVYYYIAPKVWAWKEWRIKEMRRVCTKILSILPFEEEYFRRHNLDVEYVGNPSVEEIESRRQNIPSRAEFTLRHGLDGNRPFLALVPGSRKGEIRGNLPYMVEAALRFPRYQPVISVAPGITREFIRSLDIPHIGDIPLVENTTFDLMVHSEAALVTSGTATLECALLGTPQVVLYRSAGSKFLYGVMSHVLKCPHISLPNLIANGLFGVRYANEVVPELLMHQVNTNNVARHLEAILPGSPGREAQLEGYRRMRRQLEVGAASPEASPEASSEASPEASPEAAGNQAAGNRAAAAILADLRR